MVKQRGINRRAFIKRAAGTAAAVVSFPYIVSSSALGRAGGTAASDRITLGFIGTGKQSKHLMRSFLNSAGTHVLAACDVDKLKLERGQKIVEDHYAKKGGGTYKGCKSYGDFRELVARDDSRVFQTGSMQRSDWHFRLGCELVLNGYIGELKHVTVGVGGPPEDKPLAAQPVPDYLDWEMWVGPAQWRPYNSELSPHISWDGFPHWRYHSSFGGGGMTDWGAHHFDIAQWGMGMDESGPVEIVPPDGRDYKVLTYKYANGVTMTRDRANGVLFTGTKGKVEVNRGHLRTWPDELKNQKIGPNEIHLYECKNHYTDWLDAVRNRTKPICDIETGCRSVTVCHLGNIAYKLKRPLKWDPERELFVGDSEANRLLSRAMRSPWHL